MKPVVLILAAGRGERFLAEGGRTDKLEASLTTAAGTRTVLAHVIAAAQASGLPWHVVTRQDTAHHLHPGMGTSIATGVAATTDADGWLVLPGDLPLIRPDSIVQVAAALRQHATVVPEVQGQAGHPVAFAQVCRAALLALQGDSGARQVLREFPPHRLLLQDAGCILDVDTPQALARVQQAIKG